MSWFPFFKELQNVPALVVGGGRIALHKAQVLKSFGAALTVVSTSFLPGFQDVEPVCIRRGFCAEDLDGMEVVIAATNDRALNAQIGSLCRERGIEVNVVDDANLSTFQFPAIVSKAGMTAAVSSGGASPIAARYIRDRIAEAIPDNFEEVLQCMERSRAMAKDRLPECQRGREQALRKVFARCLESGAIPDDAELEALILGESIAGESEN